MDLLKTFVTIAAQMTLFYNMPQQIVPMSLFFLKKKSLANFLMSKHMKPRATKMAHKILPWEADRISLQSHSDHSSQCAELNHLCRNF